MRYERSAGYGSDIEGMRDESFRMNNTPEVSNSHHEEAPDVNEIVLKFNTELASAKLNDADTLKEWRRDAHYVLENNEQEGKKLLGMLNERIKELGVEDYVSELESELQTNLESDPITDEKIDRAAEQGSAKEEQGM